MVKESNNTNQVSADKDADMLSRISWYIERHTYISLFLCLMIASFTDVWFVAYNQAEPGPPFLLRMF